MLLLATAARSLSPSSPPLCSLPFSTNNTTYYPQPAGEVTYMEGVIYMSVAACASFSVLFLGTGDNSPISSLFYNTTFLSPIAPRIRYRAIQ